MKTIYGDHHRRHAGHHEMSGGRMVPAVECPERAERVLFQVRAAALGEVLAPAEHGLDPLRAVHNPAYVDFLATAHDRWLKEKGHAEAFPLTWPVAATAGMRDEDPPGRTMQGELGCYAFANDTAITAGSWAAAKQGSDVALTGLDAIRAGEAGVFALCRPPGHHAGRETYGGYCYLNNAAIAAQRHLDSGGRRVAILDVDFHHGNGTQEIFYARSEVLTVSIHGDTRDCFPFYCGHADESGRGDGQGANLNLPLALGSGWSEYEPALRRAVDAVVDFDPELLILSLGVDTFAGDPITDFGLLGDDYPRLAAMLPRSITTLFVLEGGYDLEHIGSNVVSFLEAWEKS
ncbi:MAG: histone deacetylase family protein [Planctomycetota bacterium]|jgi:acetoin utilization deacetylase AcuC-like enzyme